MSPITTTAIALAAAFYCCTRASGFSFYVAGIGIGLLFLEFVGFKLVAGMLVVFLCGFFSQRRTPEACNVSEGGFAFRHLWLRRWHFVLLVLTIVAIYLPIIVSGPEETTESFLENIIRHRAEVTEEAGGQTWTSVVQRQLPKAKATLPFVFVGNAGTNNDILPSSRGLIDIASGVAGVLALVFCLFSSKRNPARLFLVLTICAAVVLSGVMVVNPSRYRLVPIIPLYFLAIGALVEGLLHRWPERRGIVVKCCTAGLCLTVAFNIFIFFGEAVDDPDVQRYFYDFKLVVAQQIAALQRESPEARTLLVSDFDFLGVPSDYAFTYEPGQVDVVRSIKDLVSQDGDDPPPYHYLVAHDGHIPSLGEFPMFAECRSESFAGTIYEEHRLVVCALK